MNKIENNICVNVDIDSLRFYCAIHGLNYSDYSDFDPVWDLGVPRFLKMFDNLGLSATFFIVASDLTLKADGGVVSTINEVDKRRELVQKMIIQRHEVASHSFQHDYNISNGSFKEISKDLKKASHVLGEITGLPIIGFRAPGYNLSLSFIDAIEDSGALYSSSRLPSPPYFIAKWLIMLKKALMGQPSQSILGEIKAPFFSRSPYKHKESLLELPISVLPFLRLPAIGTFLTLYGEIGYNWLVSHFHSQPFLNIEFHGIDLIDFLDFGISQELLNSQFDLATPVNQKQTLFTNWLLELAKGRNNKTLAEVTKEINEYHEISRI